MIHPLCEEFRSSFWASPAHLFGIVGLAASVTNGILLFLLDKEISLGGVCLRILFFLVGLLCLGNLNAWDQLRRGSFFLRLFSQEANDHLNE